ncbi:CFDP2 [Symbiodinium sp. CCMP2592]|nr:CFDP2 [Symbiodinium sp. CCMP2592]
MPHGASPAVRACGYAILVSEVGFFAFLAPGVALQPTTCSATVCLLQVTCPAGYAQSLLVGVHLQPIPPMQLRLRFIAMLTTISLLTLSPNLSIMLLLRQFIDSQTLPVLGVLALHASPFSAWIGAPYYVPETVQIQLPMPCDVEDALDAVERQVQHLRLEGCDRAIAVRPQPFPSCAAFVLAPDWATYSSLSIVCLDLRDLGDSTEGPVLVSYVTRPTCLAELCREASVHSPQHCKVYIGTEAEPLQEDEEVNLASGCLVTFMRTDRLPCHANDLQYRLQFPGIWQTPPRFPTGPAVRSSLLLLHSSGRYLYRPQAAHDPGDVAAASFVGVDRASVDFHAPQDGCLERVMYRGIRVRGTLAIAEHHYDPQFVVFLDLRQVAEGVQFVVLDVPYILLVHLPRLVRFQPPPGWALKVRGGRRRRDRIEIDNSATLVFSFQYVCTSDSSETPFDPTSDGDDGDSDGAPDDSDSEDTDRRSSATTRSRSRRRGSPGTDPGHSSDHSYQGGVIGFRELEPLVSPVHLPGLLVDAACLPGADPHVDWQQDARLHFLASAIGSGTRRLLVDEGAAFYRRASCRYAGAPELILEPHTLLAAFQAALHAKLLSEPVPHGSADAARLRALRHATEHLGGDWRYFAPTTRLHASLAEVPDSSSDEDQEVRLRRAAFIICTPGYAPEFVVVEVQFPTTLPELIPRLRAARRPEQDFRFPHLTPATPQPIEGTGLFLAAPHWCANARVVCIDATRLNGRLFAAYAPAYADNDTLADLSGAHGLDATFYAGLSQEPIPEGVLTHLVAGSTVSIFAPHIEPPPLQDLGQLLLDAGQWSSRPLYVYPEPADAYCLVRATHHQLFRADPGKPTHYRRRLAATVGAPEAHITVTPSAPRVVGIDIAGVPCRTAVAVSIHTPDRALRHQQDIILDCRPIQEGLSLWPAHSGLLFLPDLLAHFQSRVPVGYSVQVTPDTRHGVHLSVHAGAVVVVDFVAQHPHAPQASRGLSAAAPGPPDQRRVHFAADPPLHKKAMPCSARWDLDPESFLSLYPQYQVQLNAPVPSSEAIAAVQAARLPSHRERFPRLLAVTPQPDMEYGTLLAAPEWPMSEVLVFFDLRGFDDRYFALNVPSTMTLGSFVTVADVPATAELLVYIRDMPWPLGGDVPVDLLPGDLVVFLRPDHSIAVHASLGDMLQQSVGWASEPDIPGEYGDRIWLVTDHEPLLFEVNRRRAHAFRQDVAAALDISSHSIRLQPVWPNILTFAAQGLLVRSVLIAVESPPLPADGTSGWVVCLLDLRPILLGLVAAHAPDGRYDAPGLRQRLQGFCPPGYCVAITGGHTRDDSSTGYLTVFAGEVLSVNFVALASTSLSSTPEVSRNEPGDGGDPGATPGPSSENGLGAPPSSSTSRPATFLRARLRRVTHKAISPLCSSPFRPIAGRLVYPDKIAVALPFAVRRGDILQFCFLLSAYPPSQGKLSRFIAVHLKAQPVTALLTSLVCPVGSLLGCPSTPVLPFVSPSILIQPKGASATLSDLFPPHQAIEDFDDQSASSSGTYPTADFACNAHVEARTDDDICCDLGTLLWESARDPDCQAFMLASTLLETCFEHFGDGGPPLSRLHLELAARISLPSQGSSSFCPFWQGLDRALVCSPWSPDALPGLHGQSPHAHLHIGQYQVPCTVEQLLQFLMPDCSLGSGWDLVFATQQHDLCRVRLLDFRPEDFLSSHMHCFTDGSYTAATSAKAGSCTWACLFICPVSGSCAAVSGAVPPWTLQDERPSAYIAECYALLVAAWLSITKFAQIPVTLRSDCQSAIGVFQGCFVGAPCGVAAVLRSLGLFALEFSPHPPQAAYVAGHSGCLGNELADCLARSAAQASPCGCLRWSPDGAKPWWFQDGHSLGWAAIAVANLSANEMYPGPHVDEVPPCADSIGRAPLQLVAPFLPGGALSSDTPITHVWGKLSLRVCSFNVLSLNSVSLEGTAADGLAFQPARPALLAECFRAAGVHVALIQEARTQEGLLRTQGYLRYSSGSTNGTLGVEVWLLENHALFNDPDGKKGLRLSASACMVLHRDPRRLLLLFRQDGFNLLFVSAHAPHRAVEIGTISAWWAETNRLCQVHAHSALVLVGGDMNASVGSVTSAAIGGQDPDQQDDAGALFVDFLHSQRLWVPSTFPSCQQGPSGTYVQKRNGAFSRIDFIACPAERRAGHISTWTDESLHAGQAYIDHIAVCAQFDLTLRLAGRSMPALHRRFDGRAMLTPSGQAKVEGILKAAPRIPWAASPHAHASTLVHYLQDSLAAAFPPQKGRCYRAYLSDSTWQLHGEVMRLRKQCVSVKRALSFHLVAAVFQVWKQADSGPLLHMLNSQWTKEAQYAGAVQSHFLCLTSQRLKAACKHDRAVHFSELADDVQNSRPNADKAVQRLMGLRRKKPFRPEVLPELHKADGSRCVTPAEATERWREHFREQEDGYDIAPEMLPGLASGPGFVLSPDMLTELPSPDILLQVIASSHKGKAAGPDGLPAEVGHASPQCLAQLLMPLMLKMGLTCVEPIGFKGGTLTKLYKGRGDTAQCASYRAIMLLPTLAKLLHKAFRPGLYEVFHSNASPAQLGGLKNTSVVLGSHITRAFGRYCAANSITSVVLFADVASAYYTAVRALTARKHVADGEDDNAYMPTREHLAEELSKPSAMRQAHASPWIESLTAELNSNTWMCLAGDSQPVVTRQGSRPGSSFADLFYGVTVPRMLRWRDEARNGAASPASSPSDVEHAPVIWWDGRFDFSEPCTDPTACTTSTTLCDVIWADDLAKCIAVHNARCAAAATATECGLLADAFYAHGYELSFGPAKTAAIVVPRGAGSRQARKTLFSGKSVLPIFREEVGCASLPLVTTYRHLGVKISSSISIMTELRHRASHAWSAFQQGRTKVFRTRRISVKKRGLLLSTHVMTKLLFAAGAWPPLSKGEHSFFFRTVVSLYRQTLSIPHGDDQHLTHATICALVGQPPPEVLLLTERARYLLQLLNAAPEQLWALVRRDAAYVAHLRSALFWVYRWVCDTSSLGSPDDQWPEWEQVMRHRPHIFKALIKRAQGLELMRTACYAALQAVRRALEQLVKGSPPPEPKGIRYQEACLQCKIAFPSRTAWACHASRLHAYRASSTLLAAGCDRPVCKACGRLYASIGRLKRHLSTSESCRRGWGAFHPLPGGTSTLHPEAPPVALPGVHDGFSAALDPAKVHPGLLRELQELSAPLTEDVWDVVQGYIEPLPLLKDTLEEWAQHPGPEQDTDIAAAIAGDVCLLLDPELWCEDFRTPKSPPMPAVACPPFADFDFGRLSFVLTGAEHIVDIEEPPLRAFVYPFGASVPLAAARRHTAWMEATCDAIGLTLQQSLASPVRIRLSPLAAEEAADLDTTDSTILLEIFVWFWLFLIKTGIVVPNSLANSKEQSHSWDDSDKASSRLQGCNFSSGTGRAILHPKGVNGIFFSGCEASSFSFLGNSDPLLYLGHDELLLYPILGCSF